jgi:hypothetical protein
MQLIQGVASLLDEKDGENLRVLILKETGK